MRIKILVIDDEEALCEILKFNLEKEGYEVDCAYSAEEALEMDLSGYSLFIVDIMMEHWGGSVQHRRRRLYHEAFCDQRGARPCARRSPSQPGHPAVGIQRI